MYGWRPHSDGLSELPVLLCVSRHGHIGACEGQTLDHEQTLARIMAHKDLAYRSKRSSLGVSVHKHTVVVKQ